MTVEYRILHDMADFERVVDLEMTVWGSAPRDAVPTHLMHAITQNGGLVVGAYEGSDVIGMALAFPARRGRRWLLWSHMAGVHPEYQGNNVGFGLKQFQRSWALEHGYETIGWTYDPLQRGNANFNLHRLGAISHIYHVNCYGDMTDAINAGLPSDRLEVEWKLRAARVRRLAAEQRVDSPPIPPPAESLLLAAAADLCPVIQPRLVASPYYLEIPYDLSRLKQRSPALALQWRLSLREVLVSAFADGLAVTDFLVGEGRCWYMLTAPETWFVYMLQCSDETLYTGITNDLERRVERHNAGRGAAYTAARRPVQLVAAWGFPGRSAALQAEAALKRQSRQFKLRLIEQQSDYQNQPFVKVN